MFNILRGTPKFAWQLIIDLIERAPSDNSLGFFAAGPLEDLLSDHGELVIARVEQRAADNPKFRRALSRLWRLGMTDGVWQRVQRAAGA